MARDEEFRKVAEDLRALGRSLARDLRQAAEQARRSGAPPGDAIRHSLRQMAGEARRNVGGPRYGRGWNGYPGPGPGLAWRRGPYRRPRRKQWAGPRWRAAPSIPGPPAPTAPARPRRLDPPPVRRRWDATTVAGVLVLLFGSAWLLGALHALAVPAEAVVALGLMLLGAAVIITARTDWSLSRRSWPLWVGGGLVVALIALSSTLGIAGTLDHVSFGTMHRTPVPGGTVYGGFGKLTVDARSVPAGSSVEVESAAGQTDITTAPGVPVVVHARVLAGRVCVAGSPRAQGLEAGVDELFGAGRAVAPLTLTVHQLAGQVTIDGGGCSRG